MRTPLLWTKAVNLLPRAYPMLAAATTQVFAVLGFILAARWLLPAELGAWAMFLTLVSFLEMARQGLVQSALVHFSAHSAAEERPLLRAAALLLGSGVSLLGALLFAGLGILLNEIWQLPGLTELLCWWPLTALLSAPLRWHDAVRTAEQDFKGILIAAVLYGCLYVASLLFGKFYLSKMTCQSFLLLQVPALLLTTLFRSSTMGRDLLAGSPLYSWNLLQAWSVKIWYFGRFGLSSNLFSMFFQRADVLLLGAFASPAGLAAYNIATRLISWLDFPLNALSQSFLPKMAAAHHQEGPTGLRRLYRQSVRLLLVFGLPLSAAAFLAADALTAFLGHQAYPEAAGLLRILLLANLAKPFGRMLGVALEASGRPSANFRMVVATLGVNLLLLALLLAPFGILGAACASTLGALLTTAAGQWMYRRRVMSYEL